ncbi:MAG TPA: class I tRNA ligase family protein, partial [Chthoniobacterales bacterium]|nr:class I tRNA ligase family protein [Chthoniobacterales bacterium]
MGKTFYITTAIDYTNSAPHIGHAYEKVLADVIARYHRLKRDNVFFLTGVDQHGQKVQQSAEKQGVPPEQFVAGVTEQFIALWDKLDVRYDAWAATTDPLHKKCVQGMLQRLFAQDQIYKDKQSGYYSVRQEQFLTDKERGSDGEFGPEWGQVEFREEENYYFKLERHKQWLLDLIDKRSKTEKPFVIPDFRETELRNAVERLSGDLCISRPKSRLSWGIELPFDPDYVNFVWFDALSNYISFVGYDPMIDKYEDQPKEFLGKWPALQIIGKDILPPAHGIYWPIMLHAIGFPDEAMPQLLVHGWWNLGGAKMSKSAGNIVDPNALADKYSAEAIRYYLMSDIATGKDADFSEGRLVERYNSDLANALGNLLNRSLNMTEKYRLGLLRKEQHYATHLEIFMNLEQLPEESGRLKKPEYLALLDHAASVMNCVSGASREMTEFAIHSSLEVSISIASRCNTLIDRTSPWQLAKSDPTSQQLDLVLYHLAESLRIIAILISPVLPKAAHGIFDQLNWKMELSGKEERFRLDDAKWGGLPDGHVVG